MDHYGNSNGADSDPEVVDDDHIENEAAPPKPTAPLIKPGTCTARSFRPGALSTHRAHPLSTQQSAHFLFFFNHFA
jgi:hypothetical protein